MRRPMPRRMFRQSSLMTWVIGFLTISPRALTSSKTGDSGTLERMIMPTMTSRMDSRNGTRQAQVPGRWTLTRKTRLASSSPTREAGLHDAGVLALASPGGVFVGHQDRAAPFGAVGQALDDADDDQQDAGPDADALVGGQQADAERGQAHQDQAGDENRFAADLVAQVPADARRRAGGPRTRRRGWRRTAGCRSAGRSDGKKSVPKYRAAAVP